MKVVIFGSRNAFPTMDEITDEIRKLVNPATGKTVDVPDEEITEVICGTARGGDESGESWAEWFGIPVRRMPADWNRQGKIAGHLRNGAMADIADAGVGFWRDMSGGTANMVAQMVARSKQVRVKVI